MADSLDLKEPVTTNELAIASMWEIAALVEVLEWKGVLTRQEIYDAITELRQRHPEATTLERPPRGSIRRPQCNNAAAYPSPALPFLTDSARIRPAHPQSTFPPNCPTIRAVLPRGNRVWLQTNLT